MKAMSKVIHIGLKLAACAGAALALAGCGGGGDSSDSGGGGATLTATTFASVSGLSNIKALDTTSTNSGSVSYGRGWQNSSGALVILTYVASASFDAVGLSVSPGAGGNYFAGVPPYSLQCSVRGSNPFVPACTSWNITLNRAAGTIDFKNTPIFDGTSTSSKGTLNASLTFTPF